MILREPTGLVVEVTKEEAIWQDKNKATDLSMNDERFKYKTMINFITYGKLRWKWMAGHKDVIKLVKYLLTDHKADELRDGLIELLEGRNKK